MKKQCRNCIKTLLDSDPDLCELCDLHRDRVIREECMKCGMVANADPSLHAERYGHDPMVWRDGQVYVFDWSTYTFVPEVRKLSDEELMAKIQNMTVAEAREHVRRKAREVTSK